MLLPSCLRRLDGSVEDYELVRQGMTERFFETLTERPHFGRLYSLLSMDQPLFRGPILRYAVLQSERKEGGSRKIFVITRPPDQMPEAIFEKGPAG